MRLHRPHNDVQFPDFCRAIPLVVALLGWLPSSRAGEIWNTLYVGGARVGFRHVTVEPITEGGQKAQRVVNQFELKLKRGGETVLFKQRWESVETPEGDMVRIDYRVDATPVNIRLHGEVSDGQFKVATDGSLQQLRQTLAWQPGIMGPFGVENSLENQPIQPGEERTVKAFSLDVGQACAVRLKATGREEVDIPGAGMRKLLRVDAVASTLEGAPLPQAASSFWVDDRGRIVKSTVQMLGGISHFRATKETALAEIGAGLDALSFAVIKVEHRIPDSTRSRDAVYLVTLKGEDPIDILPVDRRQMVRRGKAEGSAVVQVHTVKPDEGLAVPRQVDAEYIKPSRLVDSANPRIVELVHKIVADKADAWQKAVAISEWVHANLTRDLSKIGLEPASRVAQRLSGDTHAQTILMSALCRAAGIPSRSALGLVYSSQYDGFMFHAWNEVSIDGRWVALDPVFNQSEVDATHIKLDDTSLAGPDPFRAFVTLQRVMSKMTIEPEKIDTAEDPPKRVPEGAEAAPVK